MLNILEEATAAKGYKFYLYDLKFINNNNSEKGNSIAVIGRGGP
jgi:hypothetical protein